MINIIVAEDDFKLQRVLVDDLMEQGFAVTGVQDSRSLYQELLKQAAEIVILDVGLPGEDGFAIASYLKSLRKTKSIGIIMVTAHTETASRIKGLESGADIYLTKPVDLRELQAYIEALCRRLRMPACANNSSAWRFDQRRLILISPSGVEIELSHLEASFLEMVIRNSGEPVSRRDIVSKGFGKDFMAYDVRRLEAIVSRLRKKIHDRCPLARPIKVVHSVGYIFTDPAVFIE
jgi:two-component system OmpR family response regulator